MSFAVDGLYADGDGEVEGDGIHHCEVCLELADGDHCSTCDDGRCVACGHLVPKGAGSFDYRPDGSDCFCQDCAEWALFPTWPPAWQAVYLAVSKVTP